MISANVDAGKRTHFKLYFCNVFIYLNTLTYWLVPLLLLSNSLQFFKVAINFTILSDLFEIPFFITAQSSSMGSDLGLPLKKRLTVTQLIRFLFVQYI